MCMPISIESWQAGTPEVQTRQPPDAVPRRCLSRAQSALVLVADLPGSARLRGGRFNRVGVPALYTSLSHLTALREASSLPRPLQPVLLCAYRVDAEPVFDALDASQRAALGVTDEDLRCPNWEGEMLARTISASQKLADRLAAAGYVGLRTPSFAQGAEPDDVNLVLWRWGDQLPSRGLLIDDEHRLGST